MTDEQIPTDRPDGVYINLPEKVYFKQRRLGSTSFQTLAGSTPADFYYETPWLNPDHEETDRSGDARDEGTALHVLTLEGEAAFENKIAVRPDVYPDAKGVLKKWTMAAGWCKDWVAEQGEKPILSLAQVRRCRHMAALILNHPELGRPMRSGLSEVSILYHLNGVPIRSRIDKLLPRFIIDLKTYRASTRGRSVVEQCLNLVDDMNYDIQRYLYDVARQRAREFIRSGEVYGASESQMDWLRKLAEVDDWKWCWLFNRKQDDKAGAAPVVQPIYRSPDDITYRSGQTKVEAGIQNYKAYMARFGPDVPWAVVKPGYEPRDEEFSQWLSKIPTPEEIPEGTTDE